MGVGSRNKSQEEEAGGTSRGNCGGLGQSGRKGPDGLICCSSEALGPDPLVREPLEDLVRECCDWLPLMFMWMILGFEGDKTRKQGDQLEVER